MAKKIVQVPASEIIKNKQQLESERIELAKQRREIQAAQNRASGLKTAASMALALGTAGVALYKISQQAKLHKERIEHEVAMLHRQAEKDRQKQDRAASLKLIALMGGPDVAKAVLKTAYKFTPESFQSWWEEQAKKEEANAKIREQYGTTAANAEYFRAAGADAYTILRESANYLFKGEAPGLADAAARMAGRAQVAGDTLLNWKLLPPLVVFYLGGRRALGGAAR